MRAHARMGLRAGVIGLLWIATPSSLSALDVAQAIFQLPDEAAECRYVQRLLQAAQAALQGAQRLRADAEALAARGHTEDATRKMLAALAVISGLTQDDMRRVLAATQAIESKHGHLPPVPSPSTTKGSAVSATPAHCRVSMRRARGR